MAFPFRIAAHPFKLAPYTPRNGLPEALYPGHATPVVTSYHPNSFFGALQPLTGYRFEGYQDPAIIEANRKLAEERNFYEVLARDGK